MTILLGSADVIGRLGTSHIFVVLLEAPFRRRWAGGTNGTLTEWKALPSENHRLVWIVEGSSY
jgi:hypothetical protein